MPKLLRNLNNFKLFTKRNSEPIAAMALAVICIFIIFWFVLSYLPNTLYEFSQAYQEGQVRQHTAQQQKCLEQKRSVLAALRVDTHQDSLELAELSDSFQVNGRLNKFQKIMLDNILHRASARLQASSAIAFNPVILPNITKRYGVCYA